ncbi:FkbM family methyltransferase [Halobaculum marinum]|uniref:FkbM family methyltransferase n=1 Tax=Halobaculum marinum TaxID=3031996 RepID=A0ABD5WVD9_9EURY|nr:FkbM family methyltransferase [Halobaculum sp. DT55]
MIRGSEAFSRAYGAGWRLALALVGRDVTATVGNVECTFRATTRSEYTRARTLGGERHVLAAFLADLQSDDVVWDLGACVGTYACFAARVADHVVAFEPEPTNRAALTANLRHNAPRGRWTVAATALNRDGSSAGLRSEFVEAGGGHHRLVDDRAADGSPVETAAGDDIAGTAFPSPDVVKIDVQGAELAVLEGLAETLHGVHTVYIEVHESMGDRYGDSPAHLEELLREAGFELDRLAGPTTNRAGVSFLRAVRS